MSDTYTKGIYIKGEEGLSSLVRTSKEDISDALGYKPATEQSVTDVNSNLTEHINNNDASKQHITEEEKNKLLHLSYDDLENAPAISDDDNSGTLYIADEEDNVIAKVDSEGVHSVGFHAGEEGITGDGETFIIVDKNDNKALEIEANGGVRVSELYLGQSGGPLSEILTNQTESNKNLTDHINNEARHVSPEEEALWSDKSFASITDNPIEVTEDGEFVIVDDDDNKGLVLDGTGLTVDKEVYIQTKEGDTNRVAVAKTLEEVQVAIEEIPDWALQAEKPEYSYSEIQGEYKDILNAPDIEDDNSNEFVIMDQNDVIGTRIGENGIETINDITITYLKKEGESQITEVMSVRDKFAEVEEEAADFKTEVQTSIQQLTTDIGNLSNIMNFRGAFVSLSAVIDPKPGDVVIITSDYEDAIYGKVKANSEWVYDEVGAWVEIGTASATDAAVADLQERVEVIEEDLNTATTGLKDRMTAIEDEVDEFKEEVAVQFAELPEVPDWALQENKPTYEYDDLTTRPQIEDYIDDDEFVIADSEDRKGLQLTEEGLETVGNVIITYKDEEEKEQVLDVRQKFVDLQEQLDEIGSISNPDIEDLVDKIFIEEEV